MSKIDPRFLTPEQKVIYKQGYEDGHADAELNSDEEETLPPSPDEVALSLIQGLASSGTYPIDNLHALIGHAWFAVPHFYTERERYANEVAPMFFRPVNITPDKPEQEN
jgi:hypothetical protein